VCVVALEEAPFAEASFGESPFGDVPSEKSPLGLRLDLSCGEAVGIARVHSLFFFSISA